MRVGVLSVGAVGRHRLASDGARRRRASPHSALLLCGADRVRLRGRLLLGLRLHRGGRLVEALRLLRPLGVCLASLALRAAADDLNGVADVERGLHHAVLRLGRVRALLRVVVVRVVTRVLGCGFGRRCLLGGLRALLRFLWLRDALILLRLRGRTI